MDELYSTKSLSESFEKDVLNKSKRVLEWKGGNGIWKVKISGRFDTFKQYVETYANTILYMHFKNISVLSLSESTILIELL